MISYELAQQLKDAGFPETPLTVPPHKHDGSGIYPTLEELIEACGPKFALHHNIRDEGKEWCAWQINSRPYAREAYDFKEYGSTPTEAVARLWLALNPTV